MRAVPHSRDKEKRQKFPVRRENTGKKPGFGPGQRKNVVSNQSLGRPIPCAENREIIPRNRELNRRIREITGNRTPGRLPPAQTADTIPKLAGIIAVDLDRNRATIADLAFRGRGKGPL